MSNWIGLTIGQILELCGVSYSEVQMVDEPPGKLRAVEFNCREGDRARRVRLEVQYSSGLFSKDRSWDQAVVEAQPVTKVHEPAP